MISELFPNNMEQKSIFNFQRHEVNIYKAARGELDKRTYEDSLQVLRQAISTFNTFRDINIDSLPPQQRERIILTRNLINAFMEPLESPNFIEYQRPHSIELKLRGSIHQKPSDRKQADKIAGERHLINQQRAFVQAAIVDTLFSGGLDTLKRIKKLSREVKIGLENFASFEFNNPELDLGINEETLRRIKEQQKILRASEASPDVPQKQIGEHLRRGW